MTRTERRQLNTLWSGQLGTPVQAPPVRYLFLHMPQMDSTVVPCFQGPPLPSRTSASSSHLCRLEQTFPATHPLQSLGCSLWTRAQEALTAVDLPTVFVRLTPLGKAVTLKEAAVSWLTGVLGTELRPSEEQLVLLTAEPSLGTLIWPCSSTPDG